MKDMAKKVKIVVGIIVGIFAIIGGVYAFGGAIIVIEKYFAKTDEVDTVVNKLEETDELINERVDLSIMNDHINREEQNIQRMKDLRMYEQRTIEPDLSLIEKEVLEKAENRLVKLRKVREGKIKIYEQRKRRRDKEENIE